MIRALFALLTLYSTSSFASQDAVDFFLNPQSLFPSGQRSSLLLQKGFLRDEYDSSYLVEKGSRSFWLRKDELIRDLDLSSQVFVKRTNATYKVLEIKGSYIKGERTSDKVWDWIYIKDATPSPEDLGIGINLIATALRKGPSWESEVQIHLPAQTKLEVLGFKGTWAEVKFHSGGSLQGYVDLNNLILKADFAAFVLIDKTWKPVKYRELSHLVLENDERIELKSIKAWLTKSDLGIVASPIATYDLSIRNHLKIKKVAGDTWKISKIAGHGEVYWRPPPEPLSRTAGLPTEELLTQPIFSVSFHPLKPETGVVSSNGIFLTQDGKNWKLLPQFKNENHPVLISPQGEIFVGHSWSRDNGKTFQPYLRFDQIANLLSIRSKSAPHSMRFESLKILKPNQIEIGLDTGAQKVALWGDPKNALWFVR